MLKMFILNTYYIFDTLFFAKGSLYKGSSWQEEEVTSMACQKAKLSTRAISLSDLYTDTCCCHV